MLALLGYATLGFLYEVGVTAYYRLILHGRAWPASAVTLVLTLFGFWVLDRVVGAGLSWPDAVAYAAGNAAGCWVIVRLGGRNAATRT